MTWWPTICGDWIEQVRLGLTIYFVDVHDLITASSMAVPLRMLGELGRRSA